MTSRRPRSAKSCLARRPSARDGQSSIGVKAGRLSSERSGGSSTLRVGSASALARRIASYRHGAPRRALCKPSWCPISCKQRRACHACKSRERELASLQPAARTPKRKLGSDEGGGRGKDSSAADTNPGKLVRFCAARGRRDAAVTAPGRAGRFVRLELGTSSYKGASTRLAQRSIGA
jgi:hypothetical protein